MTAVPFDTLKLARKLVSASARAISTGPAKWPRASQKERALNPSLTGRPASRSGIRRTGASPETRITDAGVP
jgi:hypothetical protein